MHGHTNTLSGGGPQANLITGDNSMCLHKKGEAAESHKCRLETQCAHLKVVSSCPKPASSARTSHSESKSKGVFAKTNLSETRFKLNRKVERAEWNEIKNKPIIQKIKSRNSPSIKNENIM